MSYILQPLVSVSNVSMVSDNLPKNVRKMLSFVVQLHEGNQSDRKDFTQAHKHEQRAQVHFQEDLWVVFRLTLTESLEELESLWNLYSLLVS